MAKTQWLEQILDANQEFRNRINLDRLPVQRVASSYAVITCMDPRINLEAMGIPPFSSDGSCDSAVRIIRTIGGIAELRSLIIAIYLAGIREFAVVMHSDCGCCLAWSKIDTIVHNISKSLDHESFSRFKEEVGEPFKDNLLKFLEAFPDPRLALQTEVQRIKSADFMPPDVVVHGLLYHLTTAKLEVIVEGR